MLEIDKITKTFEGKPLLSDISFKIDKGEIVCVLGSSGSGKSTILRMIAGLEPSDSGMIRWDGGDLKDVPPYKRNFGLMFQDYALFSHLTVFDNIAFGLRMKKWDSKKIVERVNEVAILVNLSEILLRGVQDLSGGEQQRVALARSLAPYPALMMLDEPLGALDRKLKEKLLDELRSILKKSDLPTIYVTHDQAEAFAIADRIILLHEGRIAQDAPPMVVYHQPANEWVASFMGLGNVLKGKVSQNGIDLGFGLLPKTQARANGEIVWVLLRQNAKLVSENETIRGVVTDVVFAGENYKVEINDQYHFLLKEKPAIGDLVKLRIDSITVF